MTLLLSRPELERFRAVVTRRLGFDFEESRLDALADVLRQRMAVGGLNQVDAYLALLDSPATGGSEFRSLVALLTVGETYFFRNPDQMTAFSAVLGELAGVVGPHRPARILSAACSTGEETYSLAILARTALPGLDPLDLHITALDVNPVSLARAKRARYSPWALRGTSDELRDLWFREEGGEFVLDERIKRMATFEERNLIEEGNDAYWRSLACDVIFCRNVIMYFTPASRRRAVEHLALALRPGGHLFLGHAETLRGLSQDFHLCHKHDTFYYRKRDTSDAPVTRLRASGGARDEEPEPVADVFEETSWVAAIQHASERVAALAQHSTVVAIDRGARGGAARARQLGPVLDATREERFADALALLHALPADARADPDALLLRAILLTNDGRLAESEDACRELLALDELNAGAHYVMALCREHVADLAGAIEQDQTAAYLDPGFAMPHLHMALISKRSGDLETTRRELGTALVLLEREDASRVLLFGGGFSRDALVRLCRGELKSAGGER